MNGDQEKDLRYDYVDNTSRSTDISTSQDEIGTTYQQQPVVHPPSMSIN